MSDLTVATPHRARRRALATAPVVTVVLVLLAAAAAAALWAALTGFSGGTVTAGDLSLTTGTATWRQVTPGVAEPASGTLDATPEDFWSMPGDVVEIVQPVTTTLRGDNLVGALSVRFSDAGATEDVTEGRVRATVHVLDAVGHQVAPASGGAELGTVLEVPGLVGDDDGARADWQVVVRVEVLGDYVWSRTEPVDGAGSWTLGPLVVDLDQVRAAGGSGGAR